MLTNLPGYLFNKINLIKEIGTCALLVISSKRQLYENQKKIKNSQQMAVREKHIDDGASCADRHQNQRGPVPFQNQSLSNSNIFSPTQ